MPDASSATAGGTHDYNILAEQFFELFASFQGAHGRTKLTYDPAQPGKQIIKSWTEKTPPDPKLWYEHLTGDGPRNSEYDTVAGLGLVPLRDNNTVLWAAIDIDVCTIDHKALDRKRQKLGLPLVICRSKSGGAHCYLFFREPAPAEPVRVVLARWAAALGHPGCEVFPKQSTRSGPEDVGNWLNMPFYIAERTGRYCVSNGKATSPEEFLALARERWTTLEEIKAIHVDVPDEVPTVDYSRRKTPPTADVIDGVGDGKRNDTLWGLMCRYAKAGIPIEKALKLTRETAAECDPPFDERVEKWNIEENLKRAYRKFHKDEPPPENLDAQDDAFELDVFDAGNDDWNIPPREWLLGNAFCKKFISSLVASGGTGKTSVRIAQALAMATGKNITNEYVFRRCRVLFLTLEDDLDELRRRIHAAMLHHKISNADVKGWLYYNALSGMTTPSGKLLKIATVDNKGNVQPAALAFALERLITDLRIDCVIMDPFVKTHSAEENNNNEIDLVISVLARLAIEHNIAVDVPHHTNKSPNEPANANSARGASSFKDAGRLIYTITTMSAEESKRFGITEEDRKDYVRVDSAKVNIVRARPMAWFKLASVQLANANEIYKKGDNVQAIEPWTPPAALEGLDENIQQAIIDEIGQGLPDGQRYTNRSGATTRAAHLVVLKHMPNKTEGQAKEIIATFIKENRLAEETYRDPKDRKERKGLFAVVPF